MEVLNTLAAVNEILAAIGDSPVASLTPPIQKAASLANDALDRADREIQSIGWSFNTDIDFELVPNGSSEIVFAVSVLKIVPVKRSDDFVMRGVKLYDRTENTFTFTSSVTADVTTALAFDDLPTAAKNAIVKRAARAFAQQLQGEVDRALLGNEQLAMLELKQFESDTGDFRLSDSPVVGRVSGRPSPMDQQIF